MTKVRAYLTLLGIAGVVLALDQATKYLVRTRLEIGESWSFLGALSPYVRVVHWNNTGAAFGLFPAGSTIFTIVAILVVLAILYYYPQVPADQVGLRIALPLQLGGALGNLTDRLVVGTVTDFIAVGKFPVFNVADSSISIGVAVLVVAMWIEERDRRRRAAEEAAAAGQVVGEEPPDQEQAVG